MHNLGHFRGSGGLEAHVQLQLHGAGDGLDESARLKPAGGRHEPLGHAGGKAKRVQPLGHPALDPGAQHLDRDLSPVVQMGGMGLGQRGGGDGGLQVGKQALYRTAEGALDLHPGLIQRKGRQTVLEPPEVERELRAEDVGPGGQHLAQLDGGGSQTFEGPAQPLSRTTDVRLLAREQVQQGRQRPQPGRQKGRDLARHQGVVPDQDPAPADQAQGRCHGMAHRQGPGRCRGLSEGAGQGQIAQA